MADPLGDILGAPFKAIGGDLGAQVIGRIALGMNGMNPFEDPTPTFFKELSDELVRPGTHAGRDFVNTYINPVGMFYDRNKGSYDFSQKKRDELFGTPGDAALSSVSMIPGLTAARPVKRVNVALKKVAAAKAAKPVQAVKPAAKPVAGVTSSFKSGYRDALERSLQSRVAGGN
jgi:hypothetical protein